MNTPDGIYILSGVFTSQHQTSDQNDPARPGKPHFEHVSNDSV